MTAAATARRSRSSCAASASRFAASPVLRGVDLAIREGETFTILGGSGSGKSVCLKHMIGLLKPDAGA